MPSYIEGLKKLKIDAQAEEGFPLPKWSVEEHLIFGTDYPYVSAPILLKKKSALDAEVAKRNLKEKIYCDNAKKLLEGFL